MTKGQAGFRDRPFIAGDGVGAPIRLLATRCASCEAVMFPPQDGCGRCGSEDVGEVEVGPRGRLWSFTVQTFRPPSPPYDGGDQSETFQPFGVGMIEFPNGLLVQARLTESNPGRLHIGQPVEAVLEAIPRAGGDAIETYAFRPVQEEPAQ